MRIISTILLTYLMTAAVHPTMKPQYAIIIDAGSSGSRLHLFEYQTGASVPVIKDIFSEKTSPGLSSFEKKPEEAPSSLKTLLDHASAELVKKHITPSQVSISVMGTAGMRLLSPPSQKAIYDQINTYLKNHYAFKPKRIGTISGKMEGIYGWLDINYLSGTFNSKIDATIGSIDMGGASTQIAFSTTDRTRSNDEMDLKIGGRSYTVYSISFIGFGQDQARESINSNPLAAACYPTNFPMPNSTMGNYNLATCKLIYNELINLHHIKERVLAPSSKQPFIAYSGIYAVDHFLNVEKTPDQTSVEKNIQTLCTQSWDQLKQQYFSTPEKYLAGYCANGSYHSDLLYETYQLHGSQLTVTNQINKKDIDWTLGALLYQLL